MIASACFRYNMNYFCGLYVLPPSFILFCFCVFLIPSSMDISLVLPGVVIFLVTYFRSCFCQYFNDVDKGVDEDSSIIIPPPSCSWVAFRNGVVASFCFFLVPLSSFEDKTRSSYWKVVTVSRCSSSTLSHTTFRWFIISLPPSLSTI